MKTTISLAGTKEAALYFDKVFPVDSIAYAFGSIERLRENRPLCVPYENRDLSIKVIRSLIGKSNLDKSDVLSLITTQTAMLADDIITKSYMQRDEFEHSFLPTRNILKKLIDVDIEYDYIKKNPGKLSHIAEDILNKDIKKFGFSSASTWQQAFFLENNSNSNTSSDSDRFEITLSGMELIDPLKLSWEEIIEFRKDKDNFKSLRDLRLFFYDNLAGKDPAYAADRILQLHDDHIQAARIWGFETVQKSIAAAFSNKSLLMTSVGSIATTIGGGTLPAIASAALAFPIGKFVMEFAKVAIDAEKSKIKRTTHFLTKLSKLKGERD